MEHCRLLDVQYSANVPKGFHPLPKICQTAKTERESERGKKRKKHEKWKRMTIIEEFVSKKVQEDFKQKLEKKKRENFVL